MSQSQGSLFQPEVWNDALDKYGAVTQLTVSLYDNELRTVCGPAPASPIFAVFRKYDYDPGIFLDCARKCLAQAVERPAVVVAPSYGLAVVGTSLLLEGSIVAAAVAGYVLTDFSPSAAIEQLAREGGIPFSKLWEVTRRLQPLPRRRLAVFGDLLQVLGDAILRENYRTRQYEIAAARAEAADRAKDQFLAIISHELRTPLASIIGWGHVLADPKAKPEMVSKGREAIERNAAVQKQLVDDLLDVSAITSGKLKLNPQPVQLISIVKEAIGIVRFAASAKDIELRASVDPHAAEITGDSDRLQQVFWNLLSNAIKFTPAGGRVEVRVERSDPFMRITVADTGKGIPPEFLPHVFDRFSQADTSNTRRYSGLGLGLAIVRHIVEMHGGTITANSGGEGQGAEFTIALPIRAVRSTPAGAGAAHSLSSPTETGLDRLDGLRVLVVDDQPDARDLLAAVLAQYGVRVTTASSGAEALARLVEDEESGNGPDVLITDIGMPDEDGYSLMRKVRNLGRDHGGFVPAVALTAFAGTEDEARSLAAGFQAHLGKPVDPQELRRVIARIARAAGLVR